MVWNGGALINAINPATVNSVGTYTVTATSATNGCTNTSQVIVTSNTTPPSVTSVSSGNISCTNTNVTLTGTSTGNTMVWNGGALTNATNPATVTASATYTVTATNPINGCTNTSTVNVTSNTTQPNITGGPSATISCITGAASINATSTTPGVTYSWSGTGISAGGTTANATVNAAGTFTVTVTNASNGCTNTSTVLVGLNPAPTANAGANVTITSGETTTLTASGGQTYLWSTGDILNTIMVSPKVTTQYCVEVADALGCTDTSCVTVDVSIVCGDLFVANAFSPNNDGVNDVLKVKINPACVENMQFSIYDRWGEKMIEITNPDQGWDGVYKGKQLDNGVFVYYLTIKLSNSDELIRRSGNVSILK